MARWYHPLAWGAGKDSQAWRKENVLGMVMLRLVFVGFVFPSRTEKSGEWRRGENLYEKLGGGGSLPGEPELRMPANSMNFPGHRKSRKQGG